MNSTHGGNIWPLLEKGIDPSHLLDFSVDLNPLGPPAGWQAVLREGLEEAALYPDPVYRDLRRALAEMEGVSPSCILPGNGTAELIHLITRRVKPARAIAAVPTFSEYERAVRADGGQWVPSFLREEEGFLPGPPEWAGQIGAQILFLCNPNNPTGRAWPQERLMEWLETSHRQGMMAVVDEAYIDFLEEPRKVSTVRWLSRFPRLIVLRSMTKFFAVPGLRLGFLAASEEIVSGLAEIQPPWPVNGPAALVGRWLAGQRDYLERSRQAMAVFRKDLSARLGALPGVVCAPSEANFILCRLKDRMESTQVLGAALAERGILVRLCDDFLGLEPGRFFRVAVRTPEENGRLLNALRGVLHAG